MHAWLQQNQGKTQSQRPKTTRWHQSPCHRATPRRPKLSSTDATTTRGRNPATSGEAIGMPDGAAARRDDEQIAGGPPGSLRRDCDGVRAPDRRRGGGSAAGWRDVAAWTSGRGKGGAEDRCETAGEISAPGVPPTRMAAGGRRRGRAARGERARPAAKDKAVGRPRRSASRTAGRRGMSPWTNSGEEERLRDATGISVPRGRPLGNDAALRPAWTATRVCLHGRAAGWESSHGMVA